MPRKRQNAPASVIEQEFYDAIDRLVDGKPINKDLKQRAMRGRLRFSVTAVAKEANRARSLIGHEKCAYPNVRAKIAEILDNKSHPNTAEDTIKKLRERVNELNSALRRSNSEKAALILRMTKLETSANRQLKSLQRTLDRKNKNSSQIVGSSFNDSSGNIVSLHREED